jgi:TPR repeat protein
MYFNGDGVTKDWVEACAWFNIAAVSMKEAQEMRDGLSLTPEEKAQAQKRSTELFKEIEARKKAAGK